MTFSYSFVINLSRSPVVINTINMYECLQKLEVRLA